MNRTNVTRLLTYLEQLKAVGEENKWVMSEYLADRERHRCLYPDQVTNWECGTAGCLAGSWVIIKVKNGGEPPKELLSIIDEFAEDFALSSSEVTAVTTGVWSPKGVHATLDEAIAYLRLCLDKDTMDVILG
jgi:hypothetical protein